MSAKCNIIYDASPKDVYQMEDPCATSDRQLKLENKFGWEKKTPKTEQYKISRISDNRLDFESKLWSYGEAHHINGRDQQLDSSFTSRETIIGTQDRTITMPRW